MRDLPADGVDVHYHSSPSIGGGTDPREETVVDPVRKEDEEAAESEDDEPGAADGDGAHGGSSMTVFADEPLSHDARQDQDQHHAKRKRPKRAIPWSPHLSAVTFLPSTKFKEKLRPGHGRSPYAR